MVFDIQLKIVTWPRVGADREEGGRGREADCDLEEDTPSRFMM